LPGGGEKEKAKCPGFFEREGGGGGRGEEEMYSYIGEDGSPQSKGRKPKKTLATFSSLALGRKKKKKEERRGKGRVAEIVSQEEDSALW